MGTGRRDPNTSKRSQFCIAKLPALVPLTPTLPTKYSSSDSIRSTALNVVTTGILTCFTKFLNSFLLTPAQLTPPPARINGLFAFVSSSNKENVSIFLPCISIGTSIHTGPGRPVVACFIASCTTSSTSSTLSINLAYLVMGFTMSTILASWTPKLRTPSGDI